MKLSVCTNIMASRAIPIVAFPVGLMYIYRERVKSQLSDTTHT